MFDAVVDSIRLGLADPLTIIVALLGGALARSWPRALAAGAVATLLLLGIDVATGLVDPRHIAWPLLPANFVAPLAWAALGLLIRRWHDDGEAAGVRLARGLAIGTVVGTVAGLAIGLAYVSLAAVSAAQGEASAMTMLAALLGGAVGAIVGMMRVISPRPEPPSQ